MTAENKIGMDFFFLSPQKIIIKRGRKKWKKKKEESPSGMGSSFGSFRPMLILAKPFVPSLFIQQNAERVVPAVSCCLSKRNLSWRRSQLAQRLSFGCVLLLPQSCSALS